MVVFWNHWQRPTLSALTKRVIVWVMHVVTKNCWMTKELGVALFTPCFGVTECEGDAVDVVICWLLRPPYCNPELFVVVDNSFHCHPISGVEVMSAVEA